MKKETFKEKVGVIAERLVDYALEQSEEFLKRVIAMVFGLLFLIAVFTATTIGGGLIELYFDPNSLNYLLAKAFKYAAYVIELTVFYKSTKEHAEHIKHSMHASHIHVEAEVDAKADSDVVDVEAREVSSSSALIENSKL